MKDEAEMKWERAIDTVVEENRKTRRTRNRLARKIERKTEKEKDRESKVISLMVAG